MDDDQILSRSEGPGVGVSTLSCLQQLAVVKTESDDSCVIIISLPSKSSEDIMSTRGGIFSSRLRTLDEGLAVLNINAYKL